MSINKDINVFAKTNFRNREVPFGIKTDDRRRHMYIIGKTGMGKTTMIENMIVQDINDGHGVAFVDPHGESVEKILTHIPASRINDVVYFNPADMDYPMAFNPLESVDPKYKHLVASGLMGVFTKIWANVWSARMEYILNNTILALLDTPGNTMLGIARMLVDKKFRFKIVSNIRDPIVKSFWVDEFANYNEKFRNEAVAPIQNKVGQFLSSAIIRNIVGQTKSSIDLRDIMDNQKILLLNLSKGRIGEDNSALLGAMFITKLQLAAMSRVDKPEEERVDFYLYVDEFQNFATESFATILSEARKYRLNLIIAHQYIGQLISDTKSTKIKDAVFGNVGSIIIFRIGATDAEELETEFEPNVTPNDLINLTKYNIYLKLMINGVASQPFSATTLPPIAQNTGSEDKVIKVSRERYANQRVDIEEKITRWMGQEYHREAAGQDLTDDEQESARGGVIFSGPTGEVAEPARKFPPSQPIQPVSTPRPSPVQAVRATLKRETPVSRPFSPPPQKFSPENSSGPAKPAQKIPNVWEKITRESEQKTADTLKKISKSLVFKFGEEKAKTESPVADVSQNPPAAVPPKPQVVKPLKPGETAKF